MREHIATAMKDAMKAQDKLKLSTLRLVNAAIKDGNVRFRDFVATYDFATPLVDALVRADDRAAYYPVLDDCLPPRTYFDERRVAARQTSLYGCAWAPRAPPPPSRDDRAQPQKQKPDLGAFLRDAI